MEYVVIGSVALFGALLTFFSGFGLGTVLLPAFILFFPPEVAVLLTAIVHLLNNLYKTALIGKHANAKVIFSFGLPAIAGALAGASLFANIANHVAPSSITFTLFGQAFATTQLNLLLGALMLIFALVELLPISRKLNLGDNPNIMVPGGLLSGFFGGLSGHQGALRSVFLLRFGLSKEMFIATGTGIALMVDFSRIPMYLSRVDGLDLAPHAGLLALAASAALVGAIVGKRLLTKVTIGAVHWLVGLLIMALGIALGLGLIN